MKLGIVVYSSDAETAWNAFHVGVFSLKKDDSVSIVLLRKRVECESLNTEQSPVTGQMQTFVDSGGTIFACGTYLELRESEGAARCPVSTMQHLYDMVRTVDKVLSF